MQGKASLRRYAGPLSKYMVKPLYTIMYVHLVKIHKRISPYTTGAHQHPRNLAQ